MCKAGTAPFVCVSIDGQRYPHAVMNGTDLYTVMELLGHTDPNMTKRYAHLSHEHKVTAAEKLAKRRERMIGEK